MKLDLRSLLAEDIRSLPVEFLLPVPDDLLHDPHSPLFDVCFPEPIAVAGSIVNTAGYMRMSLSVSAPYTAHCARCLRPVSDRFSISVQKTVVPAGLLVHESEEDSDDYIIVHDGFLDPDEQILSAFEAEFPAKVLCRDECRGLCPRCGKDLNDGPCNCSDTFPDPRLAPLRELLRKMHDKDNPESGLS